MPNSDPFIEKLRTLLNEETEGVVTSFICLVEYVPPPDGDEEVMFWSRFINSAMPIWRMKGMLHHALDSIVAGDDDAE